MRCWRTPAGRLLVSVTSPGGYLELAGDEVVAERASLPAGVVEVPADSLGLRQVAAVVRHPPLLPLVSNVYRAFADCRRPARLVGCPCCVESGEDAALLDPPLRELTLADLERYCWKAVTTWGTAADFCAFAPRILEILVLDEPAEMDLDVVLGKFVLAGWSGWPAARRSAVDQLLYGWWGSVLDRHPGPWPAAEVLVAVGQLIDTAALLGRWTPLSTAASALHLRDLLGDRLGVGMQLAPTADPADPLDGWLRSAELRESVDAAFFRATDPPVAEALSLVGEYLTG